MAMRGSVKWFVDTKGFGFLVGEDGQEYFVRQENIETDGLKVLSKGALVNFDVGVDEDGKLEAKRVRPVSGGADSPEEASS